MLGLVESFREEWVRERVREGAKASPDVNSSHSPTGFVFLLVHYATWRVLLVLTHFGNNTEMERHSIQGKYPMVLWRQRGLHIAATTSWRMPFVLLVDVCMSMREELDRDREKEWTLGIQAGLPAWLWLYIFIFHSPCQISLLFASAWEYNTTRTPAAQDNLTWSHPTMYFSSLFSWEHIIFDTWSSRWWTECPCFLF